MEIQRCTGHCCRRFNLPLSPSELNNLREAVDNNKTTYLTDSGEEKDFRYPKEEISKISDMVIPLGLSNIGSDGKAFEAPQNENDALYRKSNGFVIENGLVKAHFYTCKHFNKETNDCMNYINRPDMCKKHPYGRGCNFVGCTLKEDGFKCP
jgi:Fe-S-cluster containining protein